MSMTTEALLDQAAELLQAWSSYPDHPEPHRYDVDIDVDDLLAATGALIDAGWYLATITGLDAGWSYLTAQQGFDPALETGEFEFLYHFCKDAVVATLRVRADREGGLLPSVCAIIPSATFYERELMEMFGVQIKNTPNRDRLFLPDDWPNGVYPLRKDFSMRELEQD